MRHSGQLNKGRATVDASRESRELWTAPITEDHFVTGRCRNARSPVIKSYSSPTAVDYRQVAQYEEQGAFRS